LRNEELRSELEKIAVEADDGLLKEEAVVDAARDLRSPLHSEFEWDNGIAAEQYRLVQAGDLIRRVWVTISPVGNESAETVRAFVSLGSDRVAGGGYRRLVDVMTDEERKAELLKTALAELKNFQRRYESLSTVLGSVFKSIKRTIKRTEKEKRPSI